jgi:excisionase family DNA binding protein
MSTPEAASTLGVSARRVRQLLEAGELEADVIGGRSLIDADSVYRRLEHRPAPGRPLSPELAWALLAALSLGELPWNEALLSAAPDRRLRHRLIHQLSSPHDAGEWRRLLRRRADPMRYWAHPSVHRGLLGDQLVSAGRARAASAHGLDVSPGGERYIYVPRSRLGELEARYALEADPQGALVLMVYDDGKHMKVPKPGHPAPVAVAVVDMLDSNDARMQHQAATWLSETIARRMQPNGSGQ